MQTTKILESMAAKRNKLNKLQTKLNKSLALQNEFPIVKEYFPATPATIGNVYSDVNIMRMRYKVFENGYRKGKTLVDIPLQELKSTVLRKSVVDMIAERDGSKRANRICILYGWKELARDYPVV